VVLSQLEIKLLLSTPKLLKHRLLLGLLYDCGLRCFELRNIELPDLDFDRKMLHIRQGKGRKDRYVPLGSLLIKGLKTYLQSEHPQKWLFNGNNPKGEVVGLSQHGVYWVVSEARKKSGIQKPITAHTLRHSYATHLLEMGLDIVSLKEVLGHSSIESTMVYLHVSQLGRRLTFSPLDKVYKYSE
jgi:site-specific recombinase XerD